ncbi:hypothetical protein QQJ13_000572 [Escherichia coli]|nr:hypothetical protein [Escherichia coli]DAH35096.1 MAG TPA: hypothetical protein [Caudoviricetes sp.]EFN9714284.1 hypothetical protein [Escherichia coli]ELD4355182.1 hypothetical protein [Escherichia coli]MDT1416388.1 hypothetical protein [Escherichia coli]
MVVIRLWRGVSMLDGEYSRVIEDVNRGRFYELAYSEKRENKYLNESTPMWRKLRGEIAFAMRHGFYTDHNTLVDAELVTTLYEVE